ncbi:MAG TPA: hypothetical protein VKX17_17435 [Planctomycetota bacterium]|nr:hypothetical protein [Planctomycetota bacterium]
MSRVRCFGLLLPGMLLVLAGALCAAENNSSESSDAAAEEAEAATFDKEIRSPLTGMAFEGTVIINKTEDQPGILGAFKTADSSYLIKVENEAIGKELQALNSKQISVFGKIRNKGKYIVIVQILPMLEPPPSRRKTKGF